MALTRRDIVDLVARELQQGSGSRYQSEDARLGELIYDVSLVLGFMTFEDLRPSEQADLRAAVDRAGDRAGQSFITAYIDELTAWVEAHPDVRRPLPRYLHLLQPEAVR